VISFQMKSRIIMTIKYSKYYLFFIPSSMDAMEKEVFTTSWNIMILYYEVRHNLIRIFL